MINKQMIKKAVWIAMLVTVSISEYTYAGDSLVFTSLRQKGMGGVGIAQTTDAAALYTNPAGLSQAKFQVNLPLRFRMDINDDTLKDFKKVQDLMKADNKDDRLDALEKLAPMKFAFKPAISPAFAVVNRNFAVGAFAQGDIYGRILYPGDEQIEITGMTDISPMLGFSGTWRLFNRDVAVGATLRYISRDRIVDPNNGDFTLRRYTTELITGSDGAFDIDHARLTGVGADVGALMPFGNGQLGLVMYNIGSQLSGKASSTDIKVKETLPTFLGVGYSRQINAEKVPLIGGILGQFESGIDVKFEHNDMYKNIYMGVEKKVLWDALKLRAGLHQGYPSVGAALNLFLLHLQYAYYTEEKGARVGDNPQSYHGFEAVILF